MNKAFRRRVLSVGGKKKISFGVGERPNPFLSL